MIPFSNPLQGYTSTLQHLWHFGGGIYLDIASWLKLSTYCFHTKMLVPYLSVKDSLARCLVTYRIYTIRARWMALTIMSVCM